MYPLPPPPPPPPPRPNFVVKGSSRPQNEAFGILVCLILTLLFGWNERFYKIRILRKPNVWQNPS